jgi:hypothetical protein
MSKFKKSYKAKSDSSKHSHAHILSFSYDKNQQRSSNYFEWKEWWKNIGIGKYGTKIQEQFNDGIVTPFNLTEELDPLVSRPEIDCSRSAWNPTLEQRDQLRLIGEVDERRWAENDMFSVWQVAALTRNAQIKDFNSSITNKRAAVNKKAENYADLINELFSDILSSMSKNVEKEVSDMSREFNDGEAEQYENEQLSVTSKYGIDMARKTLNWYYLFETAERVCVTQVIAEQDEFGDQERVEYELTKLKQLKYLPQLEET